MIRWIGSCVLKVICSWVVIDTLAQHLWTLNWSSIDFCRHTIKFQSIHSSWLTCSQLLTKCLSCDDLDVGQMLVYCWQSIDWDVNWVWCLFYVAIFLFFFWKIHVAHIIMWLLLLSLNNWWVILKDLLILNLKDLTRFPVRTFSKILVYIEMLRHQIIEDLYKMICWVCHTLARWSSPGSSPD